MRNLLLWSILSLSFSAPAFSAEPLASYELNAPAPATLRTVGKLFEITRRSGDQYEVLVPASQRNLLELLLPEARLREADTAAGLRRRLQEFALGFTAAGESYRSLAQVQAWMSEKEKAFPAHAQVVRYGSSQGGNALLALRIGADVSAGEEKPALMLTAATHGDELITTEVLARLTDRLLTAYGREDRFTRMLSQHDVYVIPVVNPDGYARTNRYDNGVDPNRSYPFPESPLAKPTGSIRGLMDFFKTHQIVGSIDFHAYGEMIMYPWAYTRDSVAADVKARFHALTGHMAETNRYAYGPIAEVIYIAPGSSADYYFWQRQSVSLAVEIGGSKVPPPSEFDTYYRSQEESTWRFLDSFAGSSAPSSPSAH